MGAGLRMMGASGASGAGTLDPTSISGLELWLDASDESTITDTSGNVDTWTDKSDNAFEFTDTGTQPVTGTRTINSLNVVDFGGSGFMKSIASDITSTGSGLWTAFAVVETDTVTGVHNILDQDNQSTQRIGQYLRINGSNLEALTFDTAVIAYTDTRGTVSTSTPFLASGVRNTSVIEAFIDGSGDGTTSVSGTAKTGSTNITVGSFANSALQVWDGAIAEILFYNAVLSSGDIAAVETYLANKWGLTI